jgi:hypothetical protein
MDGRSDAVQHEITAPSPLLDTDGALAQVGWARTPLLDCNLENARSTRLRWLQRYRVKRWDYYGVTSPAGYFSITLADLGYAGTAFVYFVDFADGSYHEESVTIPFGRGMTLARNSDEGDTSFANSKIQITFRPEESGRHVEVRWRDFDGAPLEADLRFALPPDHESTVVAIPITGNRFYYNRKINTMPVEGSIRMGGDVVAITPDTCFGNLDWGRGVWEYRSFWVWASASGLAADGRRVGCNMGYGFGDTSAGTENTFLLEGRIHKLGDVSIDYEPTDVMRPWRFSSERVNLEFVPFIERVATTKLAVISSEVHQMFGRYTGSVISDVGESVEIDGLIGWAEEHHARW